MTTNGTSCHGDGCTNPPVAGMSFCSEDHYEELVAERKQKSGYRTANPVARDYTATLKAPSNQGLIRPPAPKPAAKKSKTALSREVVSDDTLRQLRKGGASYAQIGKQIGVDWTVIAYRCEGLGLGGGAGARLPKPHVEQRIYPAPTTVIATAPKDDYKPLSFGRDLLGNPVQVATPSHFDMVIEDLLGQIDELQMTVDLLKKHKARLAT